MVLKTVGGHELAHFASSIPAHQASELCVFSPTGLKFYRDLYQSEGTEDMAAVLDTVPVRVTEAMNKELIATISEKEVRVALSRCSLPKRRGLMDFRHIFFKDTGISAERR
jgi:hypothetical protein